MIKLVLTIVLLFAGHPVDRQRVDFLTTFPTIQACEAEKAEQLAQFVDGGGPLAQAKQTVEALGLQAFTSEQTDGFEFKLACEDASK